MATKAKKKTPAKATTRKAQRASKKAAPKTQRGTRTQAAAKAPKPKAATGRPTMPWARVSGLDPKTKIKLVMKPHGARPGTWREAMLDAIYGCKTVGEATAKKIKFDGTMRPLDLRWAACVGYINIG